MELERREQGAGLANRPARCCWWRKQVLSTLTPQSGLVQWSTGRFEGILGPCSRHYREYHLNDWHHTAFISAMILKENMKVLDIPFWSYFSWKKKKNCVPYKRGHFSPGSDQELWLSGPIGVWLAITACWLAPWAVHLCVCIYVCVLSPDPNKSLPDYYLRKEKKCQCYQTCLVGNQLRVKRPYFLIKWV